MRIMNLIGLSNNSAATGEIFGQPADLTLLASLKFLLITIVAMIKNKLLMLLFSLMTTLSLLSWFIGRL